MSENRRATRLPSSSEARPVWARALDSFYGDSFDLRSRKELAESMADFLELPPGEQAFHQAHLAFRQVQGLADVHQSLRRIEGLLGAVPVASLKHLGPMRQALEEIADAQSEVLNALEDQGTEGGDEDEDELPPDADEDPVEDEPAAATPAAEVEVLVPDIVEPPPAEATAPKKPRRSRVIDVPDAEAA